MLDLSHALTLRRCAFCAHNMFIPSQHPATGHCPDLQDFTPHLTIPFKTRFNIMLTSTPRYFVRSLQIFLPIAWMYFTFLVRMPHTPHVSAPLFSLQYCYLARDTKECKSCSFLRFPINYSLLCLNAFLSSLFSKALRLCSSLSLTPVQKSRQIYNSGYLVFTLLGSQWETGYLTMN